MSRSATAFLELPAEGDLFALIADLLGDMLQSDAITVVSDYDERAGVFRPRAIRGLDTMLEATKKILGTDPLDLSGDFGPAARKGLASGKLVKIEAGLSDFSSGLLTGPIAEAIEQLLGVTGFYVVGVVKARRIEGGLSIITRKQTTLPAAALLEAFAGQAAIALDRRRAQDSERQAEGALSIFLSAHPGPAALVSREGLILYVNEPMARRWERTQAEAIGQSAVAVVPPEIAKHASGPFKEVLKTGRPAAFEDSRAGTFYWIQMFPILDEKRDVSKVAVFAFDVTKRKRAEAASIIQRDLAVALGATQGFQQVLKQCLTAAIAAGQMDSGGLYLVDRATGALDLVCHEGLPSTFVEESSHYEPDDLHTLLVMKGEPCYLPITQLEPGLAEPLIREGLRALAVVPFAHEERIVGCLNVASHTLEDVPGDAAVQLETIAAQVGEAIALKQAGEELRASNERYQALVENAGEAIVVAQDGMIKFANSQASVISGYSREELSSISFLNFIHPDDREMLQSITWSSSPTEKPLRGRVIRILDKGNNLRWVECNTVAIDWEGRPAALNLIDDVTEREQTELYRALSTEVLGILNRQAVCQDLIRDVLAAIRGRTRCDAVGIRLQSGEDFPYFVQSGLSTDFLLAENTLVVRDPEDGICRGPDGKASLECTCGLIISGKTDPSNPLFTPGGSAWTNDAASLLDIPASADPRLHPRNRCVHEGYASVVLIPIRAGQHIVGLLQLNDRRKNRFTLATIQALENIAVHIGNALLRRQAEEAVRAARDRAQSYLDTVEAIIVALDSQGRVTLANRKACRVLGYSEEGLIGLNWFTSCLPQPDGMEKVHPVFLGLMAGDIEGLEYGENPILTRNGEQRQIAWHNALLRDDQGRIVGTLSAGEDVTDRQQADEAIRIARDRAQSYLDTVEAIIVALDSEGRVTLANKKACRVLGYSEEELVGRNWFTSCLPQPDGMDRVYPALLGMMAGEAEGPEYFENPILTRDGEQRQIAWHNALLRDDRGRVVGILGAGDDVTERRRAEEAARTARDQFMTIFDEAPVGYHELDTEGRIVRVNRTELDMLGYGSQEVLGRHVWEFIAEREVSRESVLAKLAGTRPPGRNTERTYRRKDSTLIFVTCEDRLIRDTDGRIAGIRTAIQDISERKRAEEALRKSEARLREAQVMGKIGDWEFDLTTGKIHWSDEVYNLYERDRALGPPSEEEEARYYSADQARMLRQYARLAVEEGRESTCDVAAHLPSGKTVLLNASMRPRKNEAGQVTHLFGTVQDITDRKRAEEAIRTSEAQLSNALRMAHAGHWEYDVASDTFTFNENFYRIFRTTAKEVGGYTMSSADYARRFCHPDDMDKVGKEVQEAIGTDDPDYGRELEHRILYSNGEVGCIAVRFFVVKDAEGRTVTTYGVNQDITERKRAEETISTNAARLRRTLREAINALSSAIEMRDPYTAGHQERVTKLAVAIAREMGLSEDSIEALEIAGLVHDIGKLSIPAEILSKPSRLTEVEAQLLRTHPETGSAILTKIDFPWPITRIVREHHERFDGSGYPQGLRGKGLLMESKILAVADTVEAMSTHRPYRPALGIEAALREIRENRGVLYDPEVVDACVRLVRGSEDLDDVLSGNPGHLPPVLPGQEVAGELSSDERAPIAMSNRHETQVPRRNIRARRRAQQGDRQHPCGA